jgi:hypothetical protein
MVCGDLPKVRRADPGEIDQVLAVRRSAAGLGGRLLDWAAAMATTKDRRFLRLDCVASNHRLRRYYEKARFRHRDDVPVTGPPGSRDGGGMVGEDPPR